MQQVDLLPKFEVVEHRARLYRHRVTGQVVVAAMPEAVRRAGLVGPRLSALIAYHKFLNDFGVNMQFCLAHLIRDVKFITTLRDRATRGYGERLLEAVKRLFRSGTKGMAWDRIAGKTRRTVRDAMCSRSPGVHPPAANHRTSPSVFADTLHTTSAFWTRQASSPRTTPEHNGSAWS